MSNRLIFLVFLFTVVHTVAAQNCQTSNITASTPTSQFTDNRDGTVSDTVTGLMWKRCAEGMNWDGVSCSDNASFFTWSNALQQAAASGYAGKADWRLPNIKELRSIVERQCSDPSINLSVFPNTPSSYFWSGSPVAGDSSSAWSVSFGNGYASWDGRYFGSAVRLVRGGQ
ncbi:conserved exported hypothetical protein [Gammaproteobacteria bacterium]